MSPTHERLPHIHPSHPRISWSPCCASMPSLPALDEPRFADAFERYADARVVLIGEASHGTSEFYRARAASPGG